MRTISRFLGFLALLLASLTFLRPRSKWAAVMLEPLKLLAGGCAPLMALAGALASAFGLLRRDGWAVGPGILGAALAVRHVARVTAAHDGFERAFGAGWELRIPSGLRERLRTRRYTPWPPAPPRIPCDRDRLLWLDPASGEPLRADIWHPPQGVPPSGLAVLYLHGSSWHYFDKDLGTRPFFRHVAGQGHLVVDLAYRLAPNVSLLEMVGDVKWAIAWLKATAGDHGVNPDSIVLMGASAGGHLALLAAYTPNHPGLQPVSLQADTSVRAVVSFYGPVDLRASYLAFRAAGGDLLGGQTGRDRQLRLGLGSLLLRWGLLPPGGQLVPIQDLLPSLMHGTPSEVPDLYDLGSPITHVGPHCPPTLLLQGVHDFGRMEPDVRRLHGALCAAGVPSVLVEYPETDHAFDFLPPHASPAAQAATYDVERFLALMLL